MSARELRFTAYGRPSPKGSVTRLPNGGYVHGSSKEQRERVTSWATAVSNAAHEMVEKTGWPCVDGPVTVQIRFLMPALGGTNRYRTRHVASPDIDKATRNTLDAMEVAGVFTNDARVWRLIVEKVHTTDGTIGAVIVVTDDSEAEATDREAAKDRAAAARRGTKTTAAPSLLDQAS